MLTSTAASSLRPDARVGVSDEWGKDKGSGNEEHDAQEDCIDEMTHVGENRGALAAQSVK
jgi:hypothetical protein